MIYFTRYIHVPLFVKNSPLISDHATTIACIMGGGEENGLITRYANGGTPSLTLPPPPCQTPDTPIPSRLTILSYMSVFVVFSSKPRFFFLCIFIQYDFFFSLFMYFHTIWFFFLVVFLPKGPLQRTDWKTKSVRYVVYKRTFIIASRNLTNIKKIGGMFTLFMAAFCSVAQVNKKCHISFW